MNLPIDTDALATWPATLALVVRAKTDDQQDWAAAKALRVLRDLTTHGGRVLVVELSEQRPRLARLLGIQPGPGIGEVLDGEATIPQTARRPDGEGFFFIGPGKRRAAPAASDEAWVGMADRIRGAGARLVLYCRAEEWPQPDGVPGIEGAVLLDAGGAGAPPGGVKVLAQLVAPSVVRGLPAVSPPRAEGPVLARRRPRRRMPALGLIVFAALAIAIAWWLTGPASSGSGEGATAEPRAAAAGPPAIDPAAVRHLPYSVQVESYSAFPDALERERELASLRAAVFIAPAAVDNVLYYRVFAGLEAEPDSAQALLRRLVERGIKDSVRASDVRTLPWAFDLGLFRDRQDAERRRRELVELGVPGYIVEVPTTAGVGYRLYVGGYENATEAQVMATKLERNGIRVPLVPRIGS